MKKIYFSIGIIAILCMSSILLTSCKEECEVQTDAVQKESVQLNDSVYNRIFGSKSCSPDKLVLRIPVNVTPVNQNENIEKRQYTPAITTLIRFSSVNKNFDIVRIDEYNNAWRYTKKETCLAWKWSNNDKRKILYLSLDRNLQIRDTNIKSVIFIVSLPLEIKENRVNTILKRYVWDKDNSKAGAIHNIKMQKDYPNLKNILKQRERGASKDNYVFKEGNLVDSETLVDLENLQKLGGVYLEDDFVSLINEKYKAAYHDTSESPACEIPLDLKQS